MFLYVMVSQISVFELEKNYGIFKCWKVNQFFEYVERKEVDIGLQEKFK